jgi:predicted DNA-binding protein
MRTSVYSWRVTSERKAALENLARKQKRAVAELLDEAVGQWLEQQTADDDDEAELELRLSAGRAIGRISGGDPDRASQARERIRERLRRSRSRSG